MKTPEKTPDLTCRQRHVLERVLRGQSQAEIARTDRVKRSSVEAVLANARRRLGAKSTVHLAALAIAYRIVDPAPAVAQVGSRRRKAARK